MFPLGISSIATCSALPSGSGATVAAELNGYLTANDYTEFAVGITDPMKARLSVLIVCAVYCIFFAYKIAPDIQSTGQKQDTAGGGRKREEKPALAPFQETAGYVVFFLTTLGLIFQNQIAKVIVAPTWIICFLGALLMVLTGVLSGREACACHEHLNVSIVCRSYGNGWCAVCFGCRGCRLRCDCTTNAGHRAYIINGRGLKSINI